MNRETIDRDAFEGLRFWRRMSKSVRRRILFLIVADVALFTVIAWQTRATGSNLPDEASRILPNVAPIVLAGLGMTGIVCCGAIDLSIGAILGLSGTVFGILYERGFSPPICFAACFATSFVVSTYNGLLVRSLRLPAIIVTLAGLAFYRGAALILADVGAKRFSEQFTVTANEYHAPGKDHAGTILLIVLALALGWEFFGNSSRRWLALGSSDMACRLSGLRPDRILLQAFVIGGVFLGLASLLDVTNHSVLKPAQLGLGFELSVIAAVVLGGTSIFGGEGSYLGTALGALFLYLIGPAMLYAGVNEYWRTAVQGGAILAVIGIDCALSRRRKLLEELR
jgi:ribose/xylose/arabinose/galactoside ABC-type transport system permease subunit